MSLASERNIVTAFPLPDAARPVVNIWLAGASGRVGSALRRSLQEHALLLEAETGSELRITLAANSRLTIRDGEGIDATTEIAGVRTDWEILMETTHEAGLFVDCTASPEVAALYPRFLQRGIGVVTPNKIALAAPYRDYLSLQETARRNGAGLFYETTVGAALPLLETIAQLRRSGDRVRRISAVLSGTISFVLERLQSGVPFSESVREAFVRGLTEPDPAIDLSGEDVARKLVILAREAGLNLERDAIDAEPLVPPQLRFNGDIDHFIGLLARYDGRWSDRAIAARESGNRLVYIASLRGEHAFVGTGAIPLDHPLARVAEAENAILIHSNRYPDTPLKVAGPGAGPEVTAGGVLSDIVRAVRRSGAGSES